ncbi:DUF7507 domain-containing protein [Aeoliella sp. SH292]|uniref:DUF7507 domain-containing protein n=1 Tax=Aeoliella sp. SH292 TaxID=3454464 RepID=UPI003F9523B3
MSTQHRPTRRLSLALVALAILAAGGCAMNSLPRIDPTGQRLLLWPDEPTPTWTPPVQTTAPTLVPGSTAALPAAPGNVTAPPVLTDPFLPGGPSNVTTDWLGQPVVVSQPVPMTPGGQMLGGAIAVPTVPGERISITPSRILAPVGSEVVLVAGVCGENDRLMANERVEWMMDRAGTGQIVTVGQRGEIDLFRMPQNTPRKVDNFFAIGSTSPYSEMLDRGTPDPNDDIEIRRGDAWITISSPTEGTSYVSAYAPNVPNWAGRTATATVYWLDAQWVFPSSVVLAPGQSHTLTTTVTRQTDGAPVAGWIVRYRVSGGTAGLGYDGGQTSEVATNNQGRASVEISPTDDRPGTTNIAIEIIRPEQAGVAASPRVTLGQGLASINWAAGGMSGTPMPATPPPVLDSTPGAGSWQPPNTNPPPTLPPTVPTTPTTPPTTPTPAAGRPDLLLRVERKGTGPLKVGDQVEYTVTVTNQGDGEATNVKIVDDFDIGLTNAAAAAGDQFIKTDKPFTLKPGESQTLPLTFGITQPGRLSHNVTVTADNALTANERAFLTVEGGPSGAAAPTLRVTLMGPERHTVGETAVFRVVVRNMGANAANNLMITTEFDAELKPENASQGFDAQHYSRMGQIRWPVATLAAGAEIVQEVNCKCVAPSQSTCGRVEVMADGLERAAFGQKCIEIRQQLGADATLPPAPPLGGSITPPPTTQSGLGISLDQMQTTSRVGERFMIMITLRNNTQVAQQNVQLKVLVPPVLQGDWQQVQSVQPTRTESWGNLGTTLFVNAIPELAPGASYRLAIPVDPIVAGTGKLFIGTSSSALPETSAEQTVQVISR